MRVRPPAWCSLVNGPNARARARVLFSVLDRGLASARENCVRAAWRDARAHGTFRIHPLSPRTRAQVLTLRQVKDLNETQTHLATALRELGFVVYRAGESGPTAPCTTTGRS